MTTMLADWTAEDSDWLDAHIIANRAETYPLRRDPHMWELLEELRTPTAQYCKGTCGRPLVASHYRGDVPEGHARLDSHGTCHRCRRRQRLGTVSTSKIPRSAAERAAAIELVSQGWSARAIGEHLGVAERTVVRWKAAHQQENAA